MNGPDVEESEGRILKLVSGSYSDRVRSRKGLVLSGYGLVHVGVPGSAANR